MDAKKNTPPIAYSASMYREYSHHAVNARRQFCDSPRTIAGTTSVRQNKYAVSKASRGTLNDSFSKWEARA